MSMSRAKALAISAPRPPYPYEARAKRITGSGVITLAVDSASGDVTNASVTGDSVQGQSSHHLHFNRRLILNYIYETIFTSSA